MTTIAEFLISTFGESAKEIEGIDNEYLGGAGYDRVSLGCGQGGILQTWCSGETIIGFYHKLGRPTYVVRETREMEEGQLRRRRAHDKAESNERPLMSEQDWKDYHSSTPFARLRLVQSA